MRLTTHLSFDGHCEEAFQLYQRCLGGEITVMLKYGASPLAATYPGLKEKILHATLRIEAFTLTGADVPADRYAKPQGFTVQLNLEDPQAAERIYAAFADGGKVTLPLQETFWAQRFGVVTDRFGTPWEINCGKSAQT